MGGGLQSVEHGSPMGMWQFRWPESVLESLKTAMPQPQKVAWQHQGVNRAERASLLGQASLCVWFTGLSGAGNSTLANALQ
jgi:predicted GTPase